MSAEREEAGQASRMDHAEHLSDSFKLSEKALNGLRLAQPSAVLPLPPFRSGERLEAGEERPSVSPKRRLKNESNLHYSTSAAQLEDGRRAQRQARRATARALIRKLKKSTSPASTRCQRAYSMPLGVRPPLHRQLQRHPPQEAAASKAG